jgi:hypothetical protein
MKMTVFWNVVPGSLAQKITNVSEVLPASIVRAINKPSVTGFSPAWTVNLCLTQRKQHFTITKFNKLMPFSEIIAVSCENRKKSIHTSLRAKCSINER